MKSDNIVSPLKVLPKLLESIFGFQFEGTVSFGQSFSMKIKGIMPIL